MSQGLQTQSPFHQRVWLEPGELLEPTWGNGNLPKPEATRMFSASEQINGAPSVLGSHSAIQRDGMLTHPTTAMNLKGPAPSEAARPQTATVRFHSKLGPWRTRQWLPEAGAGAGLTTNRHERISRLR